ncbi:hypothetical protein [Pseudomonas migulae]|uniref:Cytochrome c domain-containing protein n=1 Tax=Pseudomonas migulae TaxID=78543 RepID=A0ABY8MP79_9PSED|nr:hypothetical protein [Pseudomonas migulae]WGK88919.1 hypothetical protein MOQ58_20585 [Pseudomonas migulae]
MNKFRSVTKKTNSRFMPIPTFAFSILISYACSVNALSYTPGFENSTPPRKGEVAEWPKEKFKANYNFPITVADQSNQPWMVKNPKILSERADYYKAVLDYGLQALDGDMTNGCPQASADWFHAPWMTRGPSGREPLCGLTKERSTRAGYVYPSLTTKRQAWAVGLYNNTGGYQFGQVWKDKNNPDLTKLNFQNGSFVIKFLFVDIDKNDKEYTHLIGSPEWKAHVYLDEKESTVIDREGKRKTKPMKLIQIDFGVKDQRFSSTTGWIFGTFMYNNQTGEEPANWRDNLVPVGLAWGNDPGKTDSASFSEGFLSDEIKSLRSTGVLFDPNKRTYFGANDRVNGPIDNPESSCLSCHGTAQVHAKKSIWQPITPAIKNGANAPEEIRMLWFRNIKSGEPFVFTDAQLSEVSNPVGQPIEWTPPLMKEFVSTDYSLQMRMGIENKYEEELTKKAKTPQQFKDLNMFYHKISR